MQGLFVLKKKTILFMKKQKCASLSLENTEIITSNT